MRLVASKDISNLCRSKDRKLNDPADGVFPPGAMKSREPHSIGCAAASPRALGPTSCKGQIDHATLFFTITLTSAAPVFAGLSGYSSGLREGAEGGTIEPRGVWSNK